MSIRNETQGRLITAVQMLAMLTLVGCVQLPHRAITQEQLSFEFVVDDQIIEFDAVTGELEENGEFVLRSEYVGSDVKLILSLVPDGLFGAYVENRLPVAQDSVVKLDATFLQIIAQPEPWNEQVHEGFTITPASARVARLATTCKAENDVGCSLIDQATGEAFILVYFDSACEITGVNESDGMTITADIQVQQPGFHALYFQDWVMMVGDFPPRAYYAVSDR